MKFFLRKPYMTVHPIGEGHFTHSYKTRSMTDAALMFANDPLWNHVMWARDTDTMIVLSPSCKAEVNIQKIDGQWRVSDVLVEG